MSDPEVELAVKLGKANVRIGALRSALEMARPYVAKAADNFGSEYASVAVLKQIDAVLKE